MSLPCEVDAPANIIMLASYCPNLFSEGYCSSIFSMATYQDPGKTGSKESWAKPGQPGEHDQQYPGTTPVTGGNPGGLQTIKYLAAQAHGSVNWVVNYKTGARSDPDDPSDVREIGSDTGAFKKDTKDTRSQKAYCTISVGGSSYGPPDWLALAIGPDNTMALAGADSGKCPDLSYWNRKVNCDQTQPDGTNEECKDLIDTGANAIAGVGGPHSCHCVAGAAPYFLNGTTPDSTVSFGGSADDGSLTKCRGGLCEIPWYAKGANGKGVNFGEDLREVMMDLCGKQTVAAWQTGSSACNEHRPKCLDVYNALFDKKKAEGKSDDDAQKEIYEDINFQNLCIASSAGDGGRCASSTVSCADKIASYELEEIPAGTFLSISSESQLYSISSHRGLAGPSSQFCKDGCQAPYYIKPETTGCTAFLSNECPCEGGSWDGATAGYVDPMVGSTGGPPGCAGNTAMKNATCTAEQYCGPTCEEIGKLDKLDEEGGRRCYQVGCKYTPGQNGSPGKCEDPPVELLDETSVPCSTSGGGASSVECVRSLFAATKWCDDYTDYYNIKFATIEGEGDNPKLDMNNMDHRVQCYYRVLAYTLADGFDLDYESPDQLGLMGIAMTLFCCKLKWLCSGKGAPKAPGSSVKSLASCPSVTCIITMTPLSGSSYGHPGYDIKGDTLTPKVATPSRFFSKTAQRNIIDEWGFEGDDPYSPGYNMCWIPPSQPAGGQVKCGLGTGPIDPSTGQPAGNAFCTRKPAKDAEGKEKVGAWVYEWNFANFPKPKEGEDDYLKAASDAMGWIYQSFLYADCPFDYVIPMLYDGGQYPSCAEGLKSNCWNTEGQGFSWEGLCSWWAYDENECLDSFTQGTPGAQPLVIPMNSNCSVVAAFIGYKDKCTFCCNDLEKFANKWWLRDVKDGRASTAGNNRIDGVVYFYLGDTSNYSQNHIYSLLQASNNYLNDAKLPSWGLGAQGFVSDDIKMGPDGCTAACSIFEVGATGSICTETCSAQAGDDPSKAGKGMSLCGGSSDESCSEAAWNRWSGFPSSLPYESNIYVPTTDNPNGCVGKQNFLKDVNGVPLRMTCLEAQRKANAIDSSGKTQLPKSGTFDLSDTGTTGTPEYYTKSELEDSNGNIEFWLTSANGQQKQCVLSKCLKGTGVTDTEEILWGPGCDGGRVGLWSKGAQHYGQSFGQLANDACFGEQRANYPDIHEEPQKYTSSYYTNGCDYVYQKGKNDPVGRPQDATGRSDKSRDELIQDASQAIRYAWSPPKPKNPNTKCD